MQFWYLKIWRVLWVLAVQMDRQIDPVFSSTRTVTGLLVLLWAWLKCSDHSLLSTQTVGFLRSSASSSSCGSSLDELPEEPRFGNINGLGRERGNAEHTVNNVGKNRLAHIVNKQKVIPDTVQDNSKYQKHNLFWGWNSATLGVCSGQEKILFEFL